MSRKTRNELQKSLLFLREKKETRKEKKKKCNIWF